MTSASRPSDPPPRSVTGRLSSRDSRSMAWSPAGTPGPSAGVAVMGHSLGLCRCRQRVPLSPGRPRRPGVAPPAGRRSGHTDSGGMKALAPNSDSPDERRRSVATRKAVGLLDRERACRTIWYSTKRRLLVRRWSPGPRGTRAVQPLALRVLSPDGISSSAYGTEEILIALVPAVGLAAFSLLCP